MTITKANRWTMYNKKEIKKPFAFHLYLKDGTHFKWVYEEDEEFKDYLEVYFKPFKIGTKFYGESYKGTPYPWNFEVETAEFYNFPEYKIRYTVLVQVRTGSLETNNWSFRK